jgi:hypothetical protein
MDALTLMRSKPDRASVNVARRRLPLRMKEPRGFKLAEFDSVGFWSAGKKSRVFGAGVALVFRSARNHISAIGGAL